MNGALLFIIIVNLSEFILIQLMQYGIPANVMTIKWQIKIICCIWVPDSNVHRIGVADVRRKQHGIGYSKWCERETINGRFQNWDSQSIIRHLALIWPHYYFSYEQWATKYLIWFTFSDKVNQLIHLSRETNRNFRTESVRSGSVVMKYTKNVRTISK